MADSSTNANAKPKVYIVIYTLYHHIYKLSLAIQEALEQNGVEAKIFQVQETLTESILEKMHAPAKPDIPVISAKELTESDGFFFGIPTRFGIFPTQMKALLDATGKLWAQGSLAGKFVATFFSTASQHGGQETTALNAVTYFAHHGMLYVPFGFANAAMFDNNEVIGGSAYGSGTVTNGDGSRQPSETELAIAKNQAKNFAAILNTYKKGELAASTKTTAAVAEAPSTSSSEPKSAERKTPVITTTNPEGQTEDAPATDGGSAAAAAATGAAAGGVAAGAVASTEATSKAAQPSTELASIENAPAATGTKPSDRQQQQQQQKSTTSQQQQLQEQESAARPTQEKPKKKKKLLWFCCGGNDSQLD